MPWLTLGCLTLDSVRRGSLPLDSSGLPTFDVHCPRAKQRGRPAGQGRATWPQSSCKAPLPGANNLGTPSRDRHRWGLVVGDEGEVSTASSGITAGGRVSGSWSSLQCLAPDDRPDGASVDPMETGQGVAGRSRGMGLANRPDQVPRELGAAVAFPSNGLL